MQVTAMGAKDSTGGLHIQPACRQLQTKRDTTKRWMQRLELDLRFKDDEIRKETSTGGKCMICAMIE
jgi:hypothetical protein